MRIFFLIFFSVNLNLSYAQYDTLKFWNGEYMVLQDGEVIYPKPAEVTIKGEAFYPVEMRAEFPGGTNSLYKYIAENIRYPSEARDVKAKGSVNTIFTVGKDGLLKNIIVQGDTTLGMGRAAYQLVKKMPRWKPAIQRGRVVTMRLTLPISFDFDEAKEKKK